jgi:hypothetical protein
MVDHVFSQVSQSPNTFMPEEHDAEVLEHKIVVSLIIICPLKIVASLIHLH